MIATRKALQAVTVAVAAAWAAGCATAPVAKPEEKPAPVVQEAPKPEPPKPLEFKTVFFMYDKADLTEASRAALKQAAEILLARPEAAVNIEGHCDERGTDEYNIDLGWKRAYAVRDYLKRMGIDEKRMYPISYGRSRPAVVGTDESAWSRNRRVELTERK